MKSVKEKLKQPSETEEIKPSLWQQVKENGQIILIALVIAFLLRIFIAEPRFIPSDSMYPSLTKGDRLIIEKVSYRFHGPNQGDIIVFQPPTQLQMQGYDRNQAFIKRIIATEGDTIAVNDGVVYVNNRPLQENYIAEPPHYNMSAVRIPPDSLFVMGDNRNNSNDSHVWGFLPKTQVIGRAVFRFWPLSRISGI